MREMDDRPDRRIEAIETLANPNLTVVAAPLRADRGESPARWIQSQMARFSDGPAHGERRRAVESVLSDLPVVALLNHTRDETEARLVELAEGWAQDRRGSDAEVPYGRWLDSGTMSLDVMPYFARRRPVTSLLQILLPAIDDVDPLVDDVRSLVVAVAAGATPSLDGDEAAERLLGHLGDGPEGIAAISVLFQTHDATAALIGQALAIDDPNCTARDRVNWAVLHAAPVTRTLRFAETKNAPIVVPLDSSGPFPLTFGSGRHACPGRHVAVLLAEAVIGPLVERRWHPLSESLEYEDRANLSLPASLVGRLETTR